MRLKIPFQNKYLISILLSCIALLIVALLTLLFSQYFQEWEEKTLDYRFRLRGSIPLHPAITIIGIDDVSLDTVGVWPWDRSIHARLIELLHSFDASVISLDLMFPRKSTDAADNRLREAIQHSGTTILAAGFQLVNHTCFTPQEYSQLLTRFPLVEEALQAQKRVREDGNLCIDVMELDEDLFKGIEQEVFQKLFLELVHHDEFLYSSEADRTRVDEMLQHFQYSFAFQGQGDLLLANRASAPMQGLSQAAAGLGHISATPDSDGVFRRVPLVIRVQEQLFPSLAFASVLTYLQVAPENVSIVPGKHIILHDAKFPEAKVPRDVTIPVDDQLQVRINYPGNWQSTWGAGSLFSFAQVLRAEEDAEWAEELQQTMKNHIFTIGYITTGTGDLGPNPVETNFFLAFLHPTVINMILTEKFLYDTGWGLNLSITVILVLFISLLAPTLPPLRFTLAVFLTIVGYVTTTIVLFNTFGIILKLVNPVLTVLILAYTLITVYWYATEERERKHLRSAFKTYVSRQMLQRILDNPQSLALTGQRKELTIMFSDVRKFSTLSDKISPEVIHRLLNLYFSRMTEIAFKYDGFVDKFIGDGLLCFFGDPITRPDHAVRAVRAAIEMQQAVREIGPEIEEKLGLDPIVIRIGINTGFVIVGNMGSAERMEYTVLGSDVNLAQRLEASATPGEVMISEKTYEHIKHEIDAREIGEINVKGFERPIQVYEVNLPFE